ncbi:hypothetical protein V1227_33420 [Lentzea sp. DG1S-22]|uniref:FitA-like ribbon-helix-helix domain-containing protein n=1 Tax=Lentzea sp. DG1S-22 TaxID=3108822 RepID=UPI002E777DE1|nr:hypothetical protein [Lentzea sp. DG1S-22]WVH79875.1 hypothetical protein V1227_33420 [Lentzea sp. DG1S-22]
MNLRDVPDEVYTALADGAAANHQSLNAFVVERLTEAARVLTIGDYLATYEPPAGTGLALEHATAAVREARDAS